MNMPESKMISRNPGSENGMELNIKKCKAISFTRRQSRTEFDYSISSEAKERVQAIRDLGVTVDTKLRFNEHISTTTAKAFAALGFIRRNTSGFTDIYALKAQKKHQLLKKVPLNY